MVSGDDGHRLTLVPHDVLGEHGLIRQVEAISVNARNVGVSEHREDAGRTQRRPDVDRS